MAAKLSTPKVTALTCIRDHGHYGPARSNTITALENAKMFRAVPSTTGGFPTLVLTKAGAAALAGALDTVVLAPVEDVAPTVPVAEPANPLADKTPVELDTRASSLDGRLYGLRALHAKYLADIHRSVGSRVTRHGGRKGWSMSNEDAVAAAQVKITGKLMPWDDDPTTALAKLGEVEAEMVANRNESDAIEVEYARRPWSRFVGVAGGHIHSGIWCAGGTIRPTTQRTWAPLLSGLSVADAVTKLGPTLCTHCFPSAPVEWTQGAAKTDDYCEGSGLGAVSNEGSGRGGSVGGWGRCTKCKATPQRTKYGTLRKHKPAK